MKRRETLQCSLQELKEQRALIEEVTARGGLDDAGPQLVVDGLRSASRRNVVNIADADF